MAFFSCSANAGVSKDQAADAVGILVTNADAFQMDARGAVINGWDIPYCELAQVVLNENTDKEAGGSAYIKTVPRSNNPYRNSSVYNFTFAPEVMGKAVELAKSAEKSGIATKIMRGKDSLFRAMFFIVK